MSREIDIEEQFHDKDRKKNRKLRKIAQDKDRSKFKKTDLAKKNTLKIDPSWQRGKVIAITGAQGDHNFLSVAKLFGARQAFEKPFDINKLLDAVKEELAA